MTEYFRGLSGCLVPGATELRQGLLPGPADRERDKHRGDHDADRRQHERDPSEREGAEGEPNGSWENRRNCLMLQVRFSP